MTSVHPAPSRNPLQCRFNDLLIDMKNEYWLDRWQRNDIGFHQNEINSYLQQYWPLMHPVGGSKVLCRCAAKAGI